MCTYSSGNSIGKHEAKCEDTIQNASNTESDQQLSAVVSESKEGLPVENHVIDGVEVQVGQEKANRTLMVGVKLPSRSVYMPIFFPCLLGLTDVQGHIAAI